MSDNGTVDARVVSCGIFDPKTSLFKQRANERARCETITCTLQSCPLRDAKACMWRPMFGFTECPYGKPHSETGFTRRAHKYSSWIRERKEKYSGIPCLGYPKNRMATVGDYVFLPYAQMTMCKSVPFLSHGGGFSNGTALVKCDDWTIANVLKLLDFRPRAIMGGEITDYQAEQIPLFKLHLREVYPEMWVQVIAERPELDETPNHVGRKALLRTLRAPLKWSTGHDKYPVTWAWDGGALTSTSPHVYDKTWGKCAMQSVRMTGVPTEDAEIVVQDNEWVTADTVFVD